MLYSFASYVHCKSNVFFFLWSFTPAFLYEYVPDIIRCLFTLVEMKGCQTLHCQNGGFCDGHQANDPTCFCPLSFSGEDCNERTYFNIRIKWTHYCGETSLYIIIIINIRHSYEISKNSGVNQSLIWSGLRMLQKHFILLLKIFILSFSFTDSCNSNISL